MTSAGKLRVAVDTLFTSPDDGGISMYNYVHTLLQYWAEQGEAEVLILVGPGNRATYADLVRSGVRLVHTGPSNERRLRRIAAMHFRMPSVLRREHVDVLYCASGTAPWRSPCPVVLKVPSMHAFGAEARVIGRARTWYRRVVTRHAVHEAAFVIANTQSNRDAIQAEFHLPEQRVVMVPEDVSPAFMPAANREALHAQLTKNHGLRRPYFLFVSALYPYKNVDTLLRAFAALVASGEQDTDLVIVGTDFQGEAARLAALAAELAISARTRFLGGVANDAVVPLVQGAIAMVYPSRNETFGKPVVEAMRCGIPVVAANRGSIPEVAKGAAVLFEPDDPSALTDALRSLVQDIDLRATLGATGIEMSGVCAWPDIARQTMELCRRAACE